MLEPSPWPCPKKRLVEGLALRILRELFQDASVQLPADVPLLAKAKSVLVPVFQRPEKKLGAA